MSLQSYVFLAYESKRAVVHETFSYLCMLVNPVSVGVFICPVIVLRVINKWSQIPHQPKMQWL
jgi:hypothetical protein